MREVISLHLVRIRGIVMFAFAFAGVVRQPRGFNNSLPISISGLLVACEWCTANETNELKLIRNVKSGY